MVSFLLVLLLLLIGGGGFLGWRYIQGQYYVGTDGHQVVIFRGINEKIIGISLSSVYRRTGIPLTHVVANDRQQVVDASIPPSNLTKAESVVTGIRHDYTCQQANAEPGRLGGAQAQVQYQDREEAGQRKRSSGSGSRRRTGLSRSSRRTARRRAAPGDRSSAERGPDAYRPGGVGQADADRPRRAAVPRPIPLPPGRRQTELLMLIFAIGVVLAAYAATGLGLNGKLPAGIAGYGLAFAALMLAAHFAVRRLAPWADPLLLPLAALLNGLGIVMIYRLQQSGRHGNPGVRISTISSTTVPYQVIWSAIGIAAFVAVLAAGPGAPGAPALHLHAGRGGPGAADDPGAAARQPERDPGRQGVDHRGRVLHPAR